MKAPARTFSNLLRRLLVQPAGQGLEYEQTVRPVELVSDSRDLSEQLLAPRAQGGGFVPIDGVTGDCAIQLQCLASGGLVIDWLTLSFDGTPTIPGFFAWLVRQPVEVLALTGTKLEAVPARPTRSILTYGARAFGDRTAGLEPMVRLYQANVSQQAHLSRFNLFVPPGFCFYLENSQNALTTRPNPTFAMQWREFEA